VSQFELPVSIQIRRWCAFQAIPEPDIQNVAAADCSARVSVVQSRRGVPAKRPLTHLTLDTTDMM